MAALRCSILCAATHKVKEAQRNSVVFLEQPVSTAVAILRSTPNFFSGVQALGRILRMISEVIAEGKAMREQYRRQYPSMEW
jgi:hypothetical protein